MENGKVCYGIRGSISIGKVGTSLKHPMKRQLVLGTSLQQLQMTAASGIGIILSKVCSKLWLSVDRGEGGESFRELLRNFN